MRRIVDSLPDAAAGPNGKEALLACLGKDRRFVGIVPYTFVSNLNRAELWMLCCGICKKAPVQALEEDRAHACALSPRQWGPPPW